MALPLLGREEPTTARVLQDALGTVLLPLGELEPHSISPRLEAKDTRGPRVAGGESESPGPGRTRASAAGRPARSPPNPHPGPLERADRYALASGGPQSSRNRQGWEWGVGEGSPSREGRAPPRECRPLPRARPLGKRGWRRGPARGGPRLYLLLRSRPRVARLAFPAPSAAAATTRLKGPGASREPAARAGSGGGRRARPETRVSGPSYPGQVLPVRRRARGAGVLGARRRRTLVRRGSGLPPEGPQVFGPPNQFPGRRGQRGRGARAERGAEPRKQNSPDTFSLGWSLEQRRCKVEPAPGILGLHGVCMGKLVAGSSRGSPGHSLSWLHLASRSLWDISVTGEYISFSCLSCLEGPMHTSRIMGVVMNRVFSVVCF
ncbi:synapsin-1-like [Ailuropoda melanoleuca]|uniref:synapsin-1-like n=1 Tax=Ailuropoda melanoleuca TaxID=9646 RepID=UPI00149440D8|nr:synapsin-1-like [Ailuropoda melanoleuca]